jgi:hypothetical protein
VKWKDYLTDLNLVPSTLNAERVETEPGIVRLLNAMNPNDEVCVDYSLKTERCQGSLKLGSLCTEGAALHFAVACSGQ